MSKPSQDESQVKDYFGTFLESVKQASPEYPDESPDVSSSASAPDTTSSVGGIAVLTALASESSTMPLSKLLDKLQVSVLEMGAILSPLIDSRLIDVTGSPGEEIVSLAPDGIRLTRATK